MLIAWLQNCAMVMVSIQKKSAAIDNDHALKARATIPSNVLPLKWSAVPIRVSVRGF